MVILQKLKKLHGVLCTRLNRIIRVIRAVFRLKGIKQRIQRDASTSMKLDPLNEIHSRHASKTDIQAHIQSFLQTPEGRRMKAEASLTLANTYLYQIINQLNRPELTIREKMLLNLALMEIMQELKKNEKILNSMPQYN
ncbi:MAG: hypothetical protein EBT26_07605, partial [Microbacteriaceae bacterium]|nr:hypothetical protein [Microbacteriaceae bacterium]